MSNTLLVPIQLDALVSDGSCLRDALADYTGLPYNDDQVRSYDDNNNIAYVSERILSEAFANNNLDLTPGIHLHWALPDA